PRSTRKPFAANCRATSNPIPLFAPVTSAIFSDFGTMQTRASHYESHVPQRHRESPIRRGTFQMRESRTVPCVINQSWRGPSLALEMTVSGTQSSVAVFSDSPHLLSVLCPLAFPALSEFYRTAAHS